MNTTETATTVTLNITPAGVAVTAGGRVLKVIKDGSTIIQRADRVLTEHKVYRSSGYSIQSGALTAEAHDLA